MLQHGTNGFTSPPKEGMLKIFSPEKSDGFGRVFLFVFVFVLHCSGIGLSMVICIVSYCMLWIFFQYEKSDGFGRERTRDLGYQRPEC
jgi:hypothetical protein